MASLEHHLEGSPEGTSGGISYAFPLCFMVLFLYIPFVFYGSIEAITEAIHRWFHFLSTASV